MTPLRDESKRDIDYERDIDRDRTGLRLAWFLAAFHAIGYETTGKRQGKVQDWSAFREAIWNVVRWRPATHWRSGVKLIHVYEDDE